MSHLMLVVVALVAVVILYLLVRRVRRGASDIGSAFAEGRNETVEDEGK